VSISSSGTELGLRDEEVDDHLEDKAEATVEEVYALFNILERQC
jgi:hypothetical protein